MPQITVYVRKRVVNETLFIITLPALQIKKVNIEA